jgi:WD40 repeat protein
MVAVSLGNGCIPNADLDSLPAVKPSVNMKPVLTIFAVTTISILFALSSRAKPGKSEEGPVSLCATYDGPAFIGPDESRNAVALHTGQYHGISFVSLDTGQLETQIAVPQRFLAASLAPDGKLLTLGESDTSGIRIRRFDVASRKEISAQFFAKQTANLAAFTPDGSSFLGVTTGGDVFKVDIKANKLDALEGAAATAQAIAISANSDRLYVAGKGITVIDIHRLRVLSTLTQETLLLGIAVSPDDKMLAVRNRHSLELLNAANGSRVGDSVVVDATPDAISSSLVNIAFSPDGSQLFYARASYVESELISFSLPALRIEKRLKVSPITSAIAVVPSRQWVLLTTGAPGKEQVEAFDMRTLAIKFQAALAAGPTRNTDPQRSGCVNTSHSG